MHVRMHNELTTRKLLSGMEGEYIDTEKLKQAIAVMQKELVTAPSEAEIKQREKEASESA